MKSNGEKEHWIVKNASKIYLYNPILNEYPDFTAKVRHAIVELPDMDLDTLRSFCDVIQLAQREAVRKSLKKRIDRVMAERIP